MRLAVGWPAADGPAVDSLATTRNVLTNSACGSPGSAPARRRTSRSRAVRAMRSWSGSTDDSEGVRNAHSATLSKPMTRTSWGTRRPISHRPRRTPIARVSVIREDTVEVHPGGGEVLDAVAAGLHGERVDALHELRDVRKPGFCERLAIPLRPQ